MPIKNYSTSISVDKTVAEITKALARAGAQAVLTEFDPAERGMIDCISFKIRVAGDHLVAFRLPNRIDGTLQTLQRQRVEPRYRTREHAARVHWRVVRDWVLAQLALIETEIADLAEVFLPYADAGDGTTLYEKFSNSPGNLLSYNPDS